MTDDPYKPPRDVPPKRTNKTNPVFQRRLWGSVVCVASIFMIAWMLVSGVSEGVPIFIVTGIGGAVIVAETL